MNYEKIYRELTNRDSRAKYTEIHHIIPKCMGGTDDKSNLVKLTAREHYIAHKLLTKIYPCLLYTSPSPRDRTRSRMPSSA